MREGAFDVLKAADIGPESVKQLKICLAGFPKILSKLRTRVTVPYPWDGA